LTRSFTDPHRNCQHLHSRPVYVKRLWHNVASQCSHEQVAWLRRKSKLIGDDDY
jgi:hypothetical protein